MVPRWFSITTTYIMPSYDIISIMTNYTYIVTIFFVANYYIMTNID